MHDDPTGWERRLAWTYYDHDDEVGAGGITDLGRALGPVWEPADPSSLYAVWIPHGSGASHLEPVTYTWSDPVPHPEDPGGQVDRTITVTWPDGDTATATATFDVDDDFDVRIADAPAIAFDPQACRAWLSDGAARDHGIDETFNAANATITIGLADLLTALDEDTQPQVWRLHPALRQVQLWRTADSRGIDGGAIITADLSVAGARVRLATLHQGTADFTAAPETAGTEAAVEALSHVADLINAELKVYRSTTTHTAPPPSDAVPT